MIPEKFVLKWRQEKKWKSLAQVEQDLIISRALIDLYNNPHISETLIFRGGTALNQLFLKPPARYSEDIDFVQSSIGPIGPIFDSIRKTLAPWLGDPQRKITRRSAKLIYRYEAISKTTSKLKIEINTTEHFQVLPLRKEKLKVKSGWWSGQANINTYEIDELMATKLRALYQRRKGRDLFDFWHVAQNGLINLDKTFEIFREYCEYDDVHFSKDKFLKNLASKVAHQDFCSDMDALLPIGLEWDLNEAYQFVVDNAIKKWPQH